MFNSKKKHARKMRENSIELAIATVQLITAKMELETVKRETKFEPGGISEPTKVSPDAKYTFEEVKDYLVDFGNYLLSDKRAASIKNEENRKSVTDADLENWADENDNCNCPVC